MLGWLVWWDSLFLGLSFWESCVVAVLECRLGIEFCSY